MLARGADSAAGKATGEAAGAPGGVVRLGEGPGSCVRAACADPLSGLARGGLCAGCMRGLHGMA